MRIMRGKWLWALVAGVACLLIALLALSLVTGPSEDRVAAVDGSVITQEDFNREMSRVKQGLLNMGKPLIDSQLSELKKEVLEQLINRELLYQESQRKGIRVREVEVDEELKVLKKGFDSDAEFKSALKEANLSEFEVKSQIKRGLAIDEFITGHFVEKVTISDEEVRAYYESHPESFKQPEQVRASHILIIIDPQADRPKRSSVRKKIEEIRQKLQKGEDFAALAKEFSQGPSSAKGGDLGYFRRGQMTKPFEDAAFALRPGEVSDIVETKFGYHLIKVIEKEPETTIAFEGIREALGRYLTQEKVQKEVNLYVQKLKENAKIKVYLTEGS
jgi:peptidyl-prolyl cis-trans isomerase C